VLLTLMAPAAAFFFGLTSTGSTSFGGTITRSQTIQYVSNGSSSDRSCIDRDMVMIKTRSCEVYELMKSVREREDISGVSQIVCRNYVSVTTFLFRLEHFTHLRQWSVWGYGGSTIWFEDEVKICTKWGAQVLNTE
jgi:hypothetical protein